MMSTTIEEGRHWADELERLAESAAPYFRFTETSGALQAPKLDEFGNAHYCRSG